VSDPRPELQSELDLLLGTAINSLAKLEALLYLYARPGAVQSAADIAAALRRPTEGLAPELDALAEAGLLDRFPLGTGRHVVYGAAEDEHVQALMSLLHERHGRSPAALIRQAAAGERGASTGE